MPKFTVERPEVHYSEVVVDAENADEALAMVREGEGEEVFLDYSHTLNDNWRVKDAKGSIVRSEICISDTI